MADEEVVELVFQADQIAAARCFRHQMANDFLLLSEFITLARCQAEARHQVHDDAHDAQTDEGLAGQPP